MFKKLSPPVKLMHESELIGTVTQPLSIFPVHTWASGDKLCGIHEGQREPSSDADNLTSFLASSSLAAGAPITCIRDPERTNAAATIFSKIRKAVCRENEAFAVVEFLTIVDVARLFYA